MLHLDGLGTALKTLLTDKADELGVELGVIRRRRVFTGSSLVQSLVFSWLNRPDVTGDQRAQMAARCRAPVTEQALDRRFTPQLGELLRRLIELGVALAVTARPRCAGLLGRFPAVVLQDSTVISLPDALKGRWPGCGGGNGQTAAAVKVQVLFDLAAGGLPGLLLEPGRRPDQATALTGEALPTGALEVADLGYFDLRRLGATAARGNFFLSRIQVGTAVFDARGRRLDLWDWLGRQPGAAVDAEVRLGAGARLRCRLIALRCPPEVVGRRRRNLEKAARKKGRPVSAARREACAWTVLVTNVPAERLGAEEALILYGARWQVERLFKAWKGGNGLAASRSAKPQRVLCEFYAKLLGALIQQWLLLTSAWDDPARSLEKAARWIRSSVYELADLVSRRKWDGLATYVENLRTELSKTSRISRRKKEPSTHQLLNPPAPMISPSA